MTIRLDVGMQTAFRILSITAVLVLGAFMAYYARTAMSMLVVAAFLALVISPAVNRIEARMPLGERKTATLIMYSFLALVVTLVFTLLVPLLSEQGSELIGRIPAYLQQLEVQGGIEVMGIDIKSVSNSVYNDVSSAFVVTAELTVIAATEIISNVFIFLLTILLSYLLVLEGPALINKSAVLIPEEIRGHATSLSKRMQHAVTGFVGGQLIITSIASSVTLLVALLLQLPSPFSLAAIIWLTGLIPLVGNTIGATVVILVALSQSLLLAVGLVFFYVAYQQIENNVLEPYIQSRTVRLTPLYVLLSALIGVHIAGFLGALLAIPGGACLRILIDDVIDRKKP